MAENHNSSYPNSQGSRDVSPSILSPASSQNGQSTTMLHDPMTNDMLSLNYPGMSQTPFQETTSYDGTSTTSSPYQAPVPNRNQSLVASYNHKSTPQTSGNAVLPFQQRHEINQVFFKLRNASTLSKHKKFSFLGVPSQVWYMKSWNSKDEWRPNYGTIISIETAQWTSQGSLVRLYAVDRNNEIFHKSCPRHYTKTGEHKAFVFRDPKIRSKIYEPSVEGYVDIPIVGNKLEVLCYPVCTVKCRGGMIGNRFQSGFIRPDSDEFKRLFPTLCCHLIVRGHATSFYSWTIVPIARPAEVQSKELDWQEKHSLAHEDKVKELQARVLVLEKENYNLQLKLKAHEESHELKTSDATSPVFGF